MMPKCIPRLEAPRVQLVAGQVDTFAEQLRLLCSTRIPSLSQRQEDKDVFRKTVAEAIGLLQRPRLVLDGQQDIVDWTVSRLRWVRGTDLPSLPLSTEVSKENPCISCQVNKFPFCVCVS